MNLFKHHNNFSTSLYEFTFLTKNLCKERKVSHSSSPFGTDDKLFVTLVRIIIKLPVQPSAAAPVHPHKQWAPPHSANQASQTWGHSSNGENANNHLDPAKKTRSRLIWHTSVMFLLFQEKSSTEDGENNILVYLCKLYEALIPCYILE